MYILYMKFFENLDLSVSQCEMSDIIEESHRFLLHIALVHVLTYVVDRKQELFGEEVIKTLVLTAIAIVIYNIVFKKIMKSKLKKVKSACYTNEDSNVEAVYGAK